MWLFELFLLDTETNCSQPIKPRRVIINTTRFSQLCNLIKYMRMAMKPYSLSSDSGSSASPLDGRHRSCGFPRSGIGICERFGLHAPGQNPPVFPTQGADPSPGPPKGGTRPWLPGPPRAGARPFFSHRQWIKKILKNPKLLPPERNHANITGFKPYQDWLGEHFRWELYRLVTGRLKKCVEMPGL